MHILGLKFVYFEVYLGSYNFQKNQDERYSFLAYAWNTFSFSSHYKLKIRKVSRNK